MNIDKPTCQKCKDGRLVPLSDYSQNGVPIRYKAWACTNPECKLCITIRGGDVYYSYGDKEARKS